MNFPSLTICIKTFLRPHCCHRLVDSIRTTTTETKILIADDSHEPIEHDDAIVIPLEFDVGIAAGRNALVEAVDTEYTLILDDDMVFTHRTHLNELLDAIEDTQLDIVAMRQQGSGSYEGVFHRENGDDVLHVLKGDRGVIDRVSLHDITHNTFIARTESLREFPWNPEYKILEHLDFFYRHRGKLSVGFYRRCAVSHLADKTDPEYMKYRYRHHDYRQPWLKEHNLQAVKSEIGPSFEREQNGSGEATSPCDD